MSFMRITSLPGENLNTCNLCNGILRFSSELVAEGGARTNGIYHRSCVATAVVSSDFPKKINITEIDGEKVEVIQESHHWSKDLIPLLEKGNIAAITSQLEKTPAKVYSSYRDQVYHEYCENLNTNEALISLPVLSLFLQKLPLMDFHYQYLLNHLIDGYGISRRHPPILPQVQLVTSYLKKAPKDFFASSLFNNQIQSVAHNSTVEILEEILQCDPENYEKHKARAIYYTVTSPEIKVFSKTAELYPNKTASEALIYAVTYNNDLLDSAIEFATANEHCKEALRALQQLQN